MNIFAIGDLHLSLGENIDKPMDVFGPAWQGYEEKLKKNWCERIKDEDVVLIPGDISWAMRLEDAAPDLAWINALPGKKIIIKGNHDLWWSSIKKMRLTYPDIVFLQNDSYVDAAHGFAVFGTRGWLSPGCDSFTEADKKIFGRERLRLEMSLSSYSEKEIYKIAMMHFPPNGFTDIFDKYKVSQVVYGHLHSPGAFHNGPEGCINNTIYSLVSLDRLECNPLLIRSF